MWGFEVRKNGVARLLLGGLGALAVLVGVAASPAHAWTAGTELAIAERAARFAPRDLQHQIEKHKADLREGVLAAKESPSAGRAIDVVLVEEVERAIESIRVHRPFAEIVQRLGQVVHYVALANDPLAVGSSDPAEGRYARDYPRYVESAVPRFAVSFFGEGRRLEEPEDVGRMVERSFARGRAYYPLLAAEYRRIEYGDGRQRFDDRSTAYGVSALSYSHAISDSIGVLRYIWIRAGGADGRTLPELTLPRAP